MSCSAPGGYVMNTWRPSVDRSWTNTHKIRVSYFETYSKQIKKAISLCQFILGA